MRLTQAFGRMRVAFLGGAPGGPPPPVTALFSFLGRIARPAPAGGQGHRFIMSSFHAGGRPRISETMGARIGVRVPQGGPACRAGPEQPSTAWVGIPTEVARYFRRSRAVQCREGIEGPPQTMTQEQKTYAGLDRMLKQLGFAVEVAEGKSRTYRHAATGALIPLPDRPREAPVLPHHLAAVQGVLQAYGLGDLNGRPGSSVSGQTQKR